MSISIQRIHVQTIKVTPKMITLTSIYGTYLESRNHKINFESLPTFELNVTLSLLNDDNRLVIVL